MTEEELILRLRPMFRRVLLKQCERDEGLIVLPEVVKTDTRYCKVVDFSDDCRAFNEDLIGWHVHVTHNLHHHLQRISGPYFIAHEGIVDQVALRP